MFASFNSSKVNLFSNSNFKKNLKNFNLFFYRNIYHSTDSIVTGNILNVFSSKAPAPKVLPFLTKIIRSNNIISINPKNGIKDSNKDTGDKDITKDKRKKPSKPKAKSDKMPAKKEPYIKGSNKNISENLIFEFSKKKKKEEAVSNDNTKNIINDNINDGNINNTTIGGQKKEKLRKEKKRKNKKKNIDDEEISKKKGNK
jgi:hypothetical protein